MIKIKIYIFNYAKDFGHLTPEFKISDQGKFFFYFLFWPPVSLDEGYFSQRLLEPGDIEVAPQLRDSLICT